MTNFEFDKEDIRQHLQMQQDIINRMATNSSNCKLWLITIVSAFTALQITNDDISGYGWLVPILCIMFWFLDSYYIGLEKVHRRKEKEFVNGIKRIQFDGQEKLDPTTIINIYSFSTAYKKGRNHNFSNTIKSMCNLSTAPFYIVLIIVFLLLSHMRVE